MKNQAKLKALAVVGGEVKYYYLKFGDINHGRPAGGIATICLLRNGGLVHRGIAFCSPLDQFNKKLGRNIALRRAIKALEWRCCGEAIPENTPARVLKHLHPSLGGYFAFLSTFSAGLTEYEQKLILPDLMVIADGRWDDRKGKPVAD